MYSLGRREDQSPINLLSTSLPTTVSGSQPQKSKPGCVKDQKIKMATPLKIFKTDRFVCTLETLTPVVKNIFSVIFIEDRNVFFYGRLNLFWLRGSERKNGQHLSLGARARRQTTSER